MRAPEAACCPACGFPVDLMRIASMSSSDRYICKSCKESLQRTSPDDPALFGAVMMCLIVAQFLKVSLWFLLLYPIIFLAVRARLKQRLPMTTFKIAEPWSLRS